MNRRGRDLFHAGAEASPNYIVLESKRPVMVVDALKDSRTRYPEFFRQNGLVSYLGLPLIVEDKTLGDVSFFTKEKHRFDDEEVELLMSLATRAAVAIHNSQLYDAMKRKTSELAALNALAVATTQSLDLSGRTAGGRKSSDLMI
jgi:GAF domain-containing protein